MAHAITLGDGATSVDLYALSAGTFVRAEWDFGAGETDEETDSVAESIPLLLRAATVTALQDAARTMERLLDDAARRALTRMGARVFLTVQWDGEADAWRSEVLGGRLELAGAPDQWGRKALEGVLDLTRRPYWEGPETPLPLTNGNRSNYTTGIEVYNANDGSGSAPNKRNNYVQIAANDVIGSVPAPVKVELKNLSGSATLNSIHLANNVFADPTTFNPLLEAEARTSGGSTASNANASGGSQLQLSGYASGQTVTWTLSSALLQKTQSRWFRLLMSMMLRSATGAQAETVQVRLRDDTGAFVVWGENNQEVSLPPNNTFLWFADLGAIPLPPADWDTNWDALQLQLTFRLASGTANTYLDCLYLMPTDSYRLLQLRPYALPTNGLVVDNGIDGGAYMEISSLRSPYVQPSGAPLMVWPGRVQRIYVLADRPTGMADITQKWAMKVWYRPRRLTI